MLTNFSHVLPEVIFEAVEQIGGRCTGRFFPLNAMENRVYDVQMEEGPNHIIKFYRPGRWDKATILSEHDFLKHAAQEEIPVVCPVANAHGETLLEINGIYFALFPKKAGRLEPELNKEQLERLGRYLGRLHNVGEKLTGRPRTTLNPTNYGRQALKALQEINCLAPGLGPIYASLVNRICDSADPLFEGVDNILIHGDCHAGNILWQGNEPFFIDFDDMLYGPPVQDFWMLIGGDDEYAKKNQDILLRAYEEMREFDDRTLKLVEPLRGLRLIYFAAWIARRWDDGAFKMAFPHFGTEKYWQQQIEHLSFQAERIDQIEK